jgi:hypothetical protein
VSSSYVARLSFEPAVSRPRKLKPSLSGLKYENKNTRKLGL